MVLPPRTPHAATASATGVRCIEAPRQRGDPLSGQPQATALLQFRGTLPVAASQNVGSAQITRFSGGAATVRLLAEPAQIGGYRAMAVASDHHAARPVLQSASVLIADSARRPSATRSPQPVHRPPSSVLCRPALGGSPAVVRP
jgi:hypothetical protein